MRGVSVVVLDIQEGEWERDTGREFNLPLFSRAGRDSLK
jgi:hypothetical protein